MNKELINNMHTGTFWSILPLNTAISNITSSICIYQYLHSLAPSPWSRALTWSFRSEDDVDKKMFEFLLWNILLLIMIWRNADSHKKICYALYA